MRRLRPEAEHALREKNATLVAEVPAKQPGMRAWVNIWAGRGDNCRWGVRDNVPGPIRWAVSRWEVPAEYIEKEWEIDELYEYAEWIFETPEAAIEKAISLVDDPTTFKRPGDDPDYPG